MRKAKERKCGPIGVEKGVGVQKRWPSHLISMHSTPIENEKFKAILAELAETLYIYFQRQPASVESKYREPASLSQTLRRSGTDG